jgi:hypothetical protein
MKTYKIYRLVDPTISPEDEKNYIRYIGWTNKTLSDRLSNHITEAKHDATQQHTHKNRWINKLLNLNLKPCIELVDETYNADEIKEMEIKYISLYAEKGCKLTNATKGGDGQLGRVVPEEQKALFEKAIDVYDKQGNFLITVKSQKECELKFGVKSPKVSQVCNGIRKSTGNLVFRFHGESFNKYEVKSMKGKNQKSKIKVYQITESGEILKEYPSINECAIEEGINKSTLQSYLNLSEFRENGIRRQCKGKYFIKKI